MGYESRITAKGQTTIPIEVRKLLGVNSGDLLRYEIDGEHVRLVRKRSAKEFAGMFYDPDRKLLTDEDIDDAIGQAVNERYERSLDRN